MQKKLELFLDDFRDGKHKSSIVSTRKYSLYKDGRQAWRAIREELQDFGISIAAFDVNKDFIVNWFNTAISTGAFEDEMAEEVESCSTLVGDDFGQSLEDVTSHDTVG